MTKNSKKDLTKEIILDLFFSEIGCSETMKEIITKILNSGEEYIGNAYLLKKKGDTIEIENLYNNEKISINEEEFIKMIDKLITNEC